MLADALALAWAWARTTSEKEDANAIEKSVPMHTVSTSSNRAIRRVYSPGVCLLAHAENDTEMVK